MSPCCCGAGVIGDAGALDPPFALVYPCLRQIAGALFRSESAANFLLQPTGVVNELFLKLAEQRRPQFNDRELDIESRARHFLTVCDAVSAASDVYGRGATLYMLLGGRAPHGAHAALHASLVPHGESRLHGAAGRDDRRGFAGLYDLNQRLLRQPFSQ